MPGGKLLNFIAQFLQLLSLPFCWKAQSFLNVLFSSALSGGWDKKNLDVRRHYSIQRPCFKANVEARISWGQIETLHNLSLNTEEMKKTAFTATLWVFYQIHQLNGIVVMFYPSPDLAGPEKARPAGCWNPFKHWKRSAEAANESGRSFAPHLQANIQNPQLRLWYFCNLQKSPKLGRSVRTNPVLLIKGLPIKGHGGHQSRTCLQMMATKLALHPMKQKNYTKKHTFFPQLLLVSKKIMFFIPQKGSLLLTLAFFSNKSSVSPSSPVQATSSSGVAPGIITKAR